MGREDRRREYCTRNEKEEVEWRRERGGKGEGGGEGKEGVKWSTENERVV